MASNTAEIGHVRKAVDCSVVGRICRVANVP